MDMAQGQRWFKVDSILGTLLLSKSKLKLGHTNAIGIRF